MFWKLCCLRGGVDERSSSVAAVVLALSGNRGRRCPEISKRIKRFVKKMKSGLDDAVKHPKHPRQCDYVDGSVVFA